MQDEPANSLTSGRVFELAEFPFARALAELKAQSACGCLQLRAGPLEKTILLKDGAPAHVDSNIA